MTDRTKAMDNLIAQDADLIDSPLVAAVRELLTDDSMEHLDTFTHNLVRAFDKHRLKVIAFTYLEVLAARMNALEAENERLREAVADMPEAHEYLNAADLRMIRPLIDALRTWRHKHRAALEPKQ